MTANDVYNVAKALPKEELNKLYNMIKSEVELELPKINNRKKNFQSSMFTETECLKYLIQHFNKKRIP